MSIIDNAKEIANLVKKYNDQDLYEKIVKLREEILELREENLNLKDKIKTLEEHDDLRNYLELRKNIYWPKHGEIAGYGKGPWCSNCYDTEQVLINLHHVVGSSMAFGSASFTSYNWSCPKCKTKISAPKPEDLEK